jgi:hypothetical protein
MDELRVVGDGLVPCLKVVVRPRPGMVGPRVARLAPVYLGKVSDGFFRLATLGINQPARTIDEGIFRFQASGLGEVCQGLLQIAPRP